jgi:hypothetical protein
MTGADGGERGRDDWRQTRVLGGREQWDGFWTDEEDMPAKKDCIPASDASRPPNSVDIPRSETTPKPPSVVPPLGEHVTVNADMTVNGAHPPPRAIIRWGKEEGWGKAGQRSAPTPRTFTCAGKEEGAMARPCSM